MMKSTFTRCAAVAAIALSAGSTPAASVTLTGWAFGSGNVVSSTAYTGWAGGFGGTLSGSGIADSTSFLTYCIELEEHFSFSSNAMTGYSVVDGASYFVRRRGDATIAERLGRLFTYVADSPTRVDTALESTALQMAVWNMVYDSDYSVMAPGRYSAVSASDAVSIGAQSLLAGAAGISRSRFDVYALEKSGSQDFVLLSTRLQRNDPTVPEPGTLALGLLAVAGLAWSGRRRN